MSDPRGMPAQLTTDQPLLSGDVFLDDAGAVHALASVSIAITDTGGTVREVLLRRDGSLWWAPWSRRHDLPRPSLDTAPRPSGD